jgi:hypothetical protein
LFLWVAVAAAVTNMAVTHRAVACRCAEPATTKAAYRRAGAVVQGRVLAIESRPEIDGWTVKLRVLRAWKVDLPEEISVTTGTDCHYEMSADREYLLFLLGDAPANLGTRRCLGNGPAAEKSASVRWLEKNGQRGKVLRTR